MNETLSTWNELFVGSDNVDCVGIELFINTKNCGFVSYLGINHQNYFENSVCPPHAHGGIGLTSSQVLNKVIQQYGKLPHSESSEKDKVILEGEIKFTNVINKSSSLG